MERKEDIIAELQNISPLLANIKSEVRQNDVPEDYFDRLQDHVVSIVKLNAGDAASDKNVPSGYFDGLPQKVMARLDLQKPAKRLHLSPYFKWIGIAASFIAVFLAIHFIMSTEKSNSYVSNNVEFNMMDDINDEDLNYLINEFSTEDDFRYLKSTQFIENEDIHQIDLESNDENLIKNILTDEEIDYLNEIM